MALQLNDFEQNIIVSKAHENEKKLYKRTPSVFNIGPKKKKILQWHPVWKTTSKYISGLASNEIVRRSGTDKKNSLARSRARWKGHSMRNTIIDNIWLLYTSLYSSSEASVNEWKATKNMNRFVAFECRNIFTPYHWDGGNKNI